MKHLFLCTTPRSGSYLFLRMLNSGPPETRFETLGEAHFNRVLLQAHPLLESLVGDQTERFYFCTPDWRDNPQFDRRFFEETLAQYYSQGNANGWISAKWFHREFMHFLNRFSGNPAENLADLTQAFGEIAWIQMKREDLYKQTVSHYVARKTQQWWAYNNADVALQATLEVPYDYHSLCGTYRYLVRERIGWENWFQLHGITPTMRFTYEALCQDHQSILQELGDTLGTPVPNPEPGSWQMLKQINPVKDRLTDLFMADVQKNGLYPVR